MLCMSHTAFVASNLSAAAAANAAAPIAIAVLVTRPGLVSSKRNEC